jgi:threonine dehydrogenase-like Zn-dependent dehydrogenase
MEQGVIDCEKLVSHELPLAEWDRGFDMMEKQEGIKLVLHP